MDLPFWMGGSLMLGALLLLPNEIAGVDHSIASIATGLSMQSPRSYNQHLQTSVKCVRSHMAAQFRRVFRKFGTTLQNAVSRRWSVHIPCGLDAGERQLTVSVAREQSVEPEGIAEAHDITRRIVVETKGEVKIELLCAGQSKDSTRVEQLA